MPDDSTTNDTAELDSGGTATATLDAPLETSATGSDTVHDTEAGSSAAETSANGQDTQASQDAAEEAAFAALAAGKGVDGAKDAVDQAKAGKTADTETPAKSAPPAPPVFDEKTDHLLSRWKFNDAGKAALAALPEEARKEFIAGLEQRTAATDTAFRELAELRKGSDKPAPEAAKDQQKPADQQTFDDEAFKTLSAHYGEDAAKDMLGVVGKLVDARTSSLSQQVQGMLSAAAADRFASQTERGFELAKDLLPANLDDKAKDAIVAAAIEELQKGAYVPGRYDLAQAIPAAVNRLYPANARASVARQIAASSNRALKGVPGRSQPAPRPAEVTEQDVLEDAAFEALNKGENVDQIRNRLGVR